MGNANHSRQLIGIFDSGVGGLSVLQEISRCMPSVPLYYLADQAHVPYGSRSLEEIRQFSLAIAHFLIHHGAQMIVVACNTASAAALKELREAFPGIPFVGMEPAVKPATQRTHNGIVGVLATPATFQGRMYNTLIERFAGNVRVLTNTLPGLVEAIEIGELDSSRTRHIIASAIQPMIAQGADTIVLGCTHYPFVLPLIREIAGPSIEVINPAPAIAHRVQFLITEHGLHFDEVNAEIHFATTGSAPTFALMIKNLLGCEASATQLRWSADEKKIVETRN